MRYKNTSSKTIEKKNAIKLLERIGTIASKNQVMSKEDFVKHAIRRLLNTLHRGNVVLLEYAWEQPDSTTTYFQNKSLMKAAKSSSSKAAT